jgi:predicted naringenin-chalcone synthase
VNRALARSRLPRQSVSHWCIHPGGRRILDSIEKSMGFTNSELKASYDVLKEVGNLSSATILFVLKRMLDSAGEIDNLLGAAFGPGLTVETFIAHK